MRIRLRNPKEDGNPADEESPGTLVSWFRGLFGKPSAPAPSPCSAFDKRWAARGKSRYLPLGRLCTRGTGDWQAEYVFDIHNRGKRQQLRIVLPEPPISAWEKARNKRMPEAARLQLVRGALETLLDLDRVPAAITITKAEIEAVETES